MYIVFWISVLATFLNGLLTGASLDQSIKQLPARHKLGSVVFSKYARAADLGNGVLFYGTLGIGAALTTISAAILTVTTNNLLVNRSFIIVAAVFSVLHSLITTQAAPLYHSQRKVSDEKTLTQIFNNFEKWQTLRSPFLLITFFSSLFAVIR